MTIIYLGLGSNVGNREQYLRNCITSLKKIVTIKKISSIIETNPMHVKKQRKFLNCVVKGKTKLSPIELLHQLQTIEKILGRKKRYTFGPREIDIDILYFGKEKINSATLTIPHPMISHRPFILELLKNIKSK